MGFPDIEAIVVDVLGTLVDEPSGIGAGIRVLAPSHDEAAVSELVALWQRHVDHEQRLIVAGERPYAASHELDREAAQHVADAVGVEDAAALARLARSGRCLSPWPDTVAGLARLAVQRPLIGLSNASRSALLGLNFHAGLRWHQALSAEDARTYKPDPSVYELAVAAAGAEPQRLLMVAAHAWDLRGAQKLGMRTAYVARPVGDPPASTDRFDFHAENLADLADQLPSPDVAYGSAVVMA
ncbi:haloacid dehalogenase type II [Pseudactinotalea sp. Z1739]|uniref:haloacid dehalogenase type II n=1 Tax=Pseudactinotalea sp. Z1739 TaxID=3413028 RepID=UPI003C7B46CD